MVPNPLWYFVVEAGTDDLNFALIRVQLRQKMMVLYGFQTG